MTLIKKWTPKEINLLKKLAAKMSIKKVAKVLNRSYDAVEKKARLQNISFSVYNTIPDMPKETSSPTEYRDIITILKKELSAPIAKITTQSKSAKEGDTLVIQFCDWHNGKTVKNEEGVEIFNTIIFNQRVNLLMEEILTLLDFYISKGTPITDVVIISNGDLCDGSGIYPTQETHSELSPPFQVMMVVDVIRRFIMALVERKLPVKIYGVKGNHGEIRGEGGKERDSNANWDLMVYLILDFWIKEAFKNKPVNIYYSELDYLNFMIQGWRYHIRHMAPIQAETSAGKAKFLGWDRIHKYDVIASAHYHHWNVGDKAGMTVIKGGSIVGIDDLSERMAEESTPKQLIWGVSIHRPTTFIYAVDLGQNIKKGK